MSKRRCIVSAGSARTDRHRTDNSSAHSRLPLQLETLRVNAIKTLTNKNDTTNAVCVERTSLLGVSFHLVDRRTCKLNDTTNAVYVLERTSLLDVSFRLSSDEMRTKREAIRQKLEHVWRVVVGRPSESG